MPLDTATAKFLEILRSANLPPMHEGTIEAARAGMKANVAQLPGSPEPVHRVEDRTLPGAGHQVPVRLYWPRAAGGGERLPILVHFHGGGWAMGDLETHDRMARYYCNHADAIVINVDYRRPPEDKFPAAVDDSYLATCWAADHAGEIGGDPARIAVVGDSAGGNLAAVVCQIAKANKRPAIAFQALVYPATDLDVSKPYESREKFGGGCYFLSTRDMEWFTAFYLKNVRDEVGDPRASPLAAKDLSGLPPAVVVTAGFDPLHDEGRAYADRLKAAGVPVEYRCFEETIHAFLSFAPIIPAGEEGLAFISARLRNALH
jgi:acetyl esterase/lipase